MIPNFYDKIVPYLTEEAEVTYSELLTLGVDSDLALLILEKLAEPNSIYSLPGDDE